MRIVKVIRAERFRRRMSWCEGRHVLARRAPKHGRVSVQGRKKLNGRYPGVEGNCRFDVQEELLQDMGSTPTLFEKPPSVAKLAERACNSGDGISTRGEKNTTEACLRAR